MVKARMSVRGYINQGGIEIRMLTSTPLLKGAKRDPALDPKG